uniref:Mos1 transposase HTH domain-containing protein n=1 Tax=Romanomermis culicivorax TaxID=13658 RepID=A0A915HH99_ROMCU
MISDATIDLSSSLRFESHIIWRIQVEIDQFSIYQRQQCPTSVHTQNVQSTYFSDQKYGVSMTTIWSMVDDFWERGSHSTSPQLHEYNLGRTAVEATRNIWQAYGQPAVSARIVEWRFAKFRTGAHSIKDESHSGRSVSVPKVSDLSGVSGSIISTAKNGSLHNNIPDVSRSQPPRQLKPSKFRSSSPNQSSSSTFFLGRSSKLSPLPPLSEFFAAAVVATSKCDKYRRKKFNRNDLPLRKAPATETMQTFKSATSSRNNIELKARSTN